MLVGPFIPAGLKRISADVSLSGLMRNYLFPLAKPVRESKYFHGVCWVKIKMLGWASSISLFRHEPLFVRRIKWRGAEWKVPWAPRRKSEIEI